MFRYHMLQEGVLENLSVFSFLGKQGKEELPEAVQEKILSLTGFQKESRKSARVLIEAKNVAMPTRIPSGQKFYVEDLCFETNKGIVLSDNKILGIFRCLIIK